MAIAACLTRPIAFNLRFSGLHVVVKGGVDITRGLGKGITDLQLAQALDLVLPRVVNESMPSTVPFVATSIPIALEFFEFSSDILFLVLCDQLNALG
jgi:hypothetical protein